MGRTIVAGSFLAIIISISIAGIVYANGFTDEIKKMSDEALTYCTQKDQKDLLLTIEKMEKSFEKRETVFSLYVRHDELEKISQALIGVKSCAIIKSYESAYTELSYINFMSEHILSREKPNLNNVL